MDQFHVGFGTGPAQDRSWGPRPSVCVGGVGRKGWGLTRTGALSAQSTCEASESQRARASSNRTRLGSGPRPRPAWRAEPLVLGLRAQHDDSCAMGAAGRDSRRGVGWCVLTNSSKGSCLGPPSRSAAAAGRSMDALAGSKQVDTAAPLLCWNLHSYHEQTLAVASSFTTDTDALLAVSEVVLCSCGRPGQQGLQPQVFAGAVPLCHGMRSAASLQSRGEVLACISGQEHGTCCG